MVISSSSTAGGLLVAAAPGGGGGGGPPHAIASSLSEALRLAAAESRVVAIYVIGGERVYREALSLRQCTFIYYTQILTDFECDTFIPPLDPQVFCLDRQGPVLIEKDVPYQLLTFSRQEFYTARAEPTTTPLPLEPAGAGAGGAGAAKAKGRWRGGGRVLFVTRKETVAPDEKQPQVGGVDEVDEEDEEDEDDFEADPDVQALLAELRALPVHKYEPRICGPNGDYARRRDAPLGPPVSPPPPKKKEEKKKEKKEEKENVEEQQYLNLVREIINSGNRKTDRTGIGTLSKFGYSCRYSLRNGRIPLLTTKKVFWRGVVEELLWMINGKTDAKELQAKGVKIWDGNGTRKYLDSIGQGHREEFDLGPIYGHQWRHFGASYINCHTDYKGQGIDQFLSIIKLIKENPDSRRIVMSAWNPIDIPQMALPPCHVLCQFYVENGELSCIMYQRSCDLGLGVPFNIASYSLLVHLMAHVCDLKPGEFIHMMGDLHAYRSHIEPLKEQIARTPMAFPTLRIRRPQTDITKFVFDDLELLDYHPQAPIKMDMAV